MERSARQLLLEGLRGTLHPCYLEAYRYMKEARGHWHDDGVWAMLDNVQNLVAAADGHPDMIACIELARAALRDEPGKDREFWYLSHVLTGCI